MHNQLMDRDQAVDHKGLARNVFKKLFHIQQLLAQELSDEFLTW
jgi:hypothetical protein